LAANSCPISSFPQSYLPILKWFIHDHELAVSKPEFALAGEESPLI